LWSYAKQDVLPLQLTVVYWHLAVALQELSAADTVATSGTMH
jgi:hypothetical protein